MQCNHPFYTLVAYMTLISASEVDMENLDMQALELLLISQGMYHLGFTLNIHTYFFRILHTKY